MPLVDELKSSPAGMSRPEDLKGLGFAYHHWWHFKLSADTTFVEKLHDVVILYVNPPTHTLVLSLYKKPWAAGTNLIKQRPAAKLMMGLKFRAVFSQHSAKRLMRARAS